MDNYKTVLNRLYKTEGVELKSEKVELGAIDDFIKEFDNAMQLQTKAMSSTTAIDAAAKKSLKIYDSAGKSFLKANARYQEIENMSKELGVDVSSKIQAMKKALSESIREIDSASKNLLRIEKIDFV
tara:strand:+ start:1120 stop:1500 length:381 start_codon:yes stop_codon:yes gene_type:complete